MKSKVILSFLTTLVILFVLCSCSNRRIDVEIDENGNASNGSVFYLIDDKNFYLDYIKYSVVEGHLEVSGYDKAGIKAEPQIVSSITYKRNKLEVLSIGEKAFSGCENLTSITIPDGVTNIGEYAFSDCNCLTSVTIPNSVISIGSSVFYLCCSLTSVTIPNSVTIIGGDAFRNCSSLTSVTIPNSVTSIGDNAFCGCNCLTSVTIPNSVASIGYGSFSECRGLNSIKVENGNTIYDSRNNCNAIIETSTNTLMVGCNNTIIPESVTSIGDDAFSGRSGLTSVTIPNSVTRIGDYAFNDCSGLTSLTIPNSVTRIGANAFCGCGGLNSIKVENANSVYDSRNNCNAIIETSTNTLMAGCNNTTIPESVTRISDYAFSGRSGLTSVTIPNSVTRIGNGVFQCCSGLTSVTIPNSVTSIGNAAFNGCSGLTSLTIPESVTSIGEWAFRSCNGLTSIKCMGNTPPSIDITDDVLWRAFDKNIDQSAILYIPMGSRDAYKNAGEWGKFKNIVEVEE